MKRRNFIKNIAMASTAMPLAINGLNIGFLPQSKLSQLMNLESDKVLVLIQMIGGNDGLNTLIPLEHYENLKKFRPNILISEKELLKIDDKAAFHPSFSGMLNLFNEGNLGIVNSVGYPNQNRSHFRSTDIWTSAISATETDTRGWLGRYLDNLHPSFPENFPNNETPHPIAITMSSFTSETCQGISSNFSMALNDPFGLTPLSEGLGGIPLNSNYGKELEFIRKSISQTNAYSDIVTHAANSGTTLQTYPQTKLGIQLKNVATLISGGLQTKIFICNIGGFDTHGGQVLEGDQTSGVHANLLAELSNAIDSFQKDLNKLGLGERVIGMTFSEFGRQIASNNSLGTDHGTAAPLFLFGNCVKPGFTCYLPEIPDKLYEQEGIAMQVDFRDVYGSILMDWFQVGKAEVKELLYENFTHLNILKDCQLPEPSDDTELKPDFNLFPNPVSNYLKIEPKHHCSIIRKISIFDAKGAEVLAIHENAIPIEQYRAIIDVSHLRPGNYYVHLKSEIGHKTKMFSKVN